MHDWGRECQSHLGDCRLYQSLRSQFVTSWIVPCEFSLKDCGLEAILNSWLLQQRHLMRLHEAVGLESVEVHAR